ncbi:excisionase [Klebsiella sp. CN_Kp100]|uniref:excisionase n=1 Tax=Klebsiella sp. CN_Kp100 TaxID=3153422 RepID=UPI0032B41E5B
MYLTLQEWNARQPIPRSLETVRRWVRECLIYPAPKKVGRDYVFHEKARRVERPAKANSIIKRINDGKKKELRKA